MNAKQAKKIRKAVNRLSARESDIIRTLLHNVAGWPLRHRLHLAFKIVFWRKP